ncbi:hypothetical protein [Prochlorococcus sp. MIT 1341]|uniref:hypothetical protein n=1 Tax=Prochlorococcus sp. MIT 1341 TaxID=3096221 RepID=UPI002A7649B5|nr:hypothetical protein [Prochlorococcus sp. MIT 1341]
MAEFSSVPNEISHKDLNSLLLSALKESYSSSNDLPESNAKEESFKIILAEWTNMSKTIVETLRTKHPSIIKDLKPKQAMALGALEVHLSMALQARFAIDTDKDS